MVEYYCPKSCGFHSGECPWKVKPELSSIPEDANYLNYCPLFRPIKSVIGRDQFIAGGLERGSLIVKEQCGCVVIKDITSGIYIVFCYEHEAAEDMREALRGVSVMLRLEPMRDLASEPWAIRVRSSLAKAQGE